MNMERRIRHNFIRTPPCLLQPYCCNLILDFASLSEGVASKGIARRLGPVETTRANANSREAMPG
jgi:hypothetical protein